MDSLRSEVKVSVLVLYVVTTCGFVGSNVTKENITLKMEVVLSSETYKSTWLYYLEDKHLHVMYYSFLIHTILYFIA